MREETQNSVNLKLIVFFDPEDHTYGIWAHNLTSKEAPRDVDELRPRGREKKAAIYERVAMRAQFGAEAREGRRQAGNLLRERVMLRRDRREKAKRAFRHCG